jgi:subtilisin-like proprotein convertase family protein
VPITIPDSGTAVPYPSDIVVSGVTGTVAKVTVTINGLTHTFPDDLDFLLVGPQGQNAIIWSDAGGGGDVTNITVTLDDGAETALPDAGPLVSGTFQPANYTPNPDMWPAPAPAPSGGSALSIFNGTDPNGTWSLYLVDDATGDLGQISGGWSLTITSGGTCPTPTPTPTATPSPSPTATPTVTPAPSPTATITPTPSPTPTVTPTVTPTPTVKPTPTVTPTPTLRSLLFFCKKPFGTCCCAGEVAAATAPLGS